MIKRIKKVLLIGSVVLGATMCMGNTNNTGDSKKIKLDYFTNIESMNVQDVKTDKLKSNEKVTICVDPGHQRKGNNGKEEIAPGSKTTKPKVSSGTAGVSTKKNEYQLTLEVGLKLKKKLEENNYNVFMTREVHDVDISNKERSVMTNNSGCSLYIRIHADGSENKSVNGMSVLTSSSKNSYTKQVQASSDKFSRIILEETVKTTGAKNNGVSYRDDLTGTNWSTITNTLIEMGFMSNSEEDKKLSSPEYQDKIVNGIVNGINRYLKEK
ncbi:MAG: N-acetylmuramoyl-L-alanine amidase [Sebaldella sp.]|nr:N-acetylmuramoyl-L-alanine amidase [Sebaldella sp.]